jgi:hypothetical protein
VKGQMKDVHGLFPVAVWLPDRDEQQNHGQQTQEDGFPHGHPGGPSQGEDPPPHGLHGRPSLGEDPSRGLQGRPQVPFLPDLQSPQPVEGRRHLDPLPPKSVPAALHAPDDP